MIETTETPEDVEKLLAQARANLQAFEDGVDRKRLLERLRTQSPMHPVLLFRSLFLALALLGMVAALVVMTVPLLSADLARTMVKFEAVVPAPPGIPGLPALLGVLVVCMLVAWMMSTLAAYAMGRDAQMLPWEQKQHQKLVNEVTRLTTQKAVMERIRGTPAGARPRIATPVPMSMRDRAGIATPPGVQRSGGFGRASGGYGPPGGGLGATPPGVGASFGRGTSAGDPPGRFGPPPGATPAPAPSGGFPQGGGADGSGGSSVLARARSGGASRGGLGSTPPGIQGRGGLGGTPPGIQGRGGLGGTPPGIQGRGGLGGTPPGIQGRGGLGGTPPGVQARGGLGAPSPFAGDTRGPSAPGGRSPLGAAPRAGQALGAGASGSSASSRSKRLAAPLGFPGTPDPAERTSAPGRSSFSEGGGGGGLFGTPPPADAMPRNGARSSGLLNKARSSAPAADDQLDITSPYLRGPRETKETAASDRRNRQTFPRWGRIDEPWLEEAIQRAESVAGTFPEQAHLEFSQETHLPFTLVIARATPAMAVRAMVGYVEFLASILTPPRGRIELKNVPHLDSSFHRNVSAALEPYFGDRFEVEPEIGRVEIVFKDPDPSWQDVPVLPME